MFKKFIYDDLAIHCVKGVYEGVQVAHKPARRTASQQAAKF